jgi:diacylglycerol kinase family enzyme
MAGIGWDAEIAAGVGEGTKRWLGAGAYVVEAARAAPRLRSHELSYTIDGVARRTAAAQVVLGNTRLYGNVARLTPEALATDGLLDVVIASPSDLKGSVAAAARMAVPRLADGPSVWRGRAHSFSVETPGIPIQLDGDVCGKTPASFRVASGVLRVSVPAGPLPPVLGG